MTLAARAALLLAGGAAGRRQAAAPGDAHGGRRQSGGRGARGSGSAPAGRRHRHRRRATPTSKTPRGERRRWPPEGIHYLGVGISGGESGARYGPSMMPGGPREAYEAVRPIFEAVAARADGSSVRDLPGPRLRRALRQDGAQRHRVRADAVDRRELRPAQAGAGPRQRPLGRGIRRMAGRRAGILSARDHHRDLPPARRPDPRLPGGPHPGRGRAKGDGHVDVSERHGPARAGAEHRHRREHAQPVGARGPAGRRAAGSRAPRRWGLRARLPRLAPPARQRRAARPASRSTRSATRSSPPPSSPTSRASRSFSRPRPPRATTWPCTTWPRSGGEAASSAPLCCGRSGRPSSGSRICPTCCSTRS